MGRKTGAMIKEARTAAGLTQSALANQIGTVTAAQISKAERGEAELSQAVLKAIAKATGVTQTSLLNAEKSTEKKETAKKAASKTTKSASEVKLSADERQLLNLYRKADDDAKKDAIRILKGEKSEVEQLVSTMLGGKLSLEQVLKKIK